MFVYLLRDAHAPRFKIGKANDIHQRIAALGGPSGFNLTESRCIRLPTPSDALRVEKILHRVFVRSNIPPTDGARYAGDTEMFRLDCFHRVLLFLMSMPDLIDNAAPGPLPTIAPRAMKPLAVPQIGRSGAGRRELIQRPTATQLEEAMPRPEALLRTLVETPEAQFEVVRSPTVHDPYRVLLAVRALSREGYEAALAGVDALWRCRFAPGPTRPGGTSLVASMSSGWSGPHGHITARLDGEVMCGPCGGFHAIRTILAALPVAHDRRREAGPDLLSYEYGDGSPFR